MSNKFAPLRLRGLKAGEIHEIDSVTGAVGFLYSLWPRSGGDQRALAEQACRQALAGDISPEAAREAFFKAALEADIIEPSSD